MTTSEQVTPAPAPRGLFVVLGLAVLVAVGLDLWLHAHGLVKMEAANTLDLELHALARDGQVVLVTHPTQYAEALHYWIFHLVLLATPRLEVAAVLLNVAHYGFAAVLFVGTRRRLGEVAAVVATTLYLTSAVAPILSKHVISTAFVPLVMPLFAFAVLDLARTGARDALGRAVLGLGALLALNHGHVVWAVPLLAVMVRQRAFRVPWWGVAGFLLLWSSGIARLVVHGGPAVTRLWGWFYRSPWNAVSRMVHVEPGAEDTVPVAWLLFGLVAVALGWWVARRDEAPPGLGWLLLPGLPLVFAPPEANPSWQTPMLLLLGWTASRSLAFAWTTALYGLAEGLGLAAMMVTFAAPPNVNFFSMSSLGLRYTMHDTLVGELGMRADEQAHLRLEHTVSEGETPSILPGMSYLAERVFPPLPEGGDRCLLVDDGLAELPAGATDVERVEDGLLVYRAWRGVPCEPNVLLKPEPVHVLDLRTWQVVLAPVVP
ncbi:MAG: hypothetical protein H6732_07895 [Alphaproteobacteria bacterium]|nr:hypothetical protein [Alphaproteobacteria bacterium]